MPLRGDEEEVRGMLMTIGRLSEMTGVPASAIRFWERHGLLPEPERRSGQRRYPPEAARRIVLLRKCQQAGLTLGEIREFQRERSLRQEMIRGKVAEIERRMVDLDHAHQLLTHALQCGEEDIVECPKFREQMARWRTPDA
ncbi:MerR family transcriptional regulator [Streptomyces sp. NBC_00249]|uniref:MerR family transcriptional regulator n=1 Tax=Streptomyces sp. NBC_00249 TaxID=2975690 RepID=UPI00225B87F6|nr:MerR family transcriptional regulator [Streptomyces sp. NBC_00249]MCX5195553.1 MerR family transcriptional regulator [Streptomyces sp. NBC_00249]